MNVASYLEVSYNAVRDFVLDESVELNRQGPDADDLVEALYDPDLSDFVSFAEHNGKVLGVVEVRRGRKASDRHVGTLRIHVRKGYRGGGIGSHLMQEALDWADSNGVVRLVATPYIAYDRGPIPTQESADKVQFFIRHGFEREGVMWHAARLKDGRLTDVMLMSRITLEADDG